MNDADADGVLADIVQPMLLANPVPVRLETVIASLQNRLLVASWFWIETARHNLLVAVESIAVA